MFFKEFFTEKALVVWKRRKAEFWEWLNYESYTWYQDLIPDYGGLRWLQLGRHWLSGV